MRYAYLHGFSSSPRSFKGTELRRRLEPRGVDLERPALHRPSFSELTYGGALEAMEDAHESNPDSWCLIGSSFGGFVAARWAELHPSRVSRLVLLCPAFDLESRWPHLIGEDAWRRWERDGAIDLPSPDGTMKPVHWKLVTEARLHPPFPVVECPTVVVHGRDDEIVPIASSRRYAAEHSNVQLVEVDDDHGLGRSVDAIEAVVVEHFLGVNAASQN